MNNTMMTLTETIANAIFSFTCFVLEHLETIILSTVALIGIYSFCTR